MNIDGKKIRDTRRSLGLTQNDLAKGICAQPTISVLESKNRCESLAIILSICDRLHIKLEEVLIESKSKPEPVSEILSQVEYLCAHSQQKQALKMLESSVDLNSISDPEELTLAYYYFGITNLIIGKNREKAQLYFLKILNREAPMKLKVLAQSSLGIYFAEAKEYEISEEYFQASLNTLRQQELISEIELARVFYNAAKFYSLIDKPQLSIEICKEGIILCKQNQTTYFLDFLLYEKAFNYMFLDREKGLKYYEIAMLIAKFNDNEIVIKTIESDLAELNS